MVKPKITGYRVTWTREHIKGPKPDMHEVRILDAAQEVAERRAHKGWRPRGDK